VTNNKQWQERLIPLCEVSATEAQGTSYYWAQDVDGEPNTLWGLEGYSHAVGFFLGHPDSEVFKREMALVDGNKLLKHEQGLGSKDYDLHHYDFESGYLTLENDAEKDSNEPCGCRAFLGEERAERGSDETVGWICRRD
jgi:hypothetical protein